MAEQSNNAAEIKGLVEGINQALVPLRKDVDELKGFNFADVVTQDRFDKMAAEVTTKMEALQDAQAKTGAALERATISTGGEGRETERKAELVKLMTAEGKGGFAIKALSTDVFPDGGALVYPELLARMATRVFETSPMRALASVEVTESTSLDVIVDDDEAAAAWAGEGSTGGVTATPQTGRIAIPVENMEAMPKATPQILRSGLFDVESWLNRKVADKFARLEATAFVTGNGVNRPKGIMSYSAWSTAGTYERDKVEQVNMGTAATLGTDGDGLISVQNALPEFYQAGATWAMQRGTFGAALKLKGNDSYFFGPVMMRDGAANLQMLGKPVVFMADVASVAANALAVAYGNFEMGYTIVDGADLTILRDPYSSKPFVQFYTTKQVGGAVTNFDAIKIGKVAV